MDMVIWEFLVSDLQNTYTNRSGDRSGTNLGVKRIWLLGDKIVTGFLFFGPLAQLAEQLTLNQ